MDKSTATIYWYNKFMGLDIKDITEIPKHRFIMLSEIPEEEIKVPFIKDCFKKKHYSVRNLAKWCGLSKAVAEKFNHRYKALLDR